MTNNDVIKEKVSSMIQFPSTPKDAVPLDTSSYLGPTTLQTRQKAPSSQPINQIRFKTHLRNTVLDVFKSRGWKETESSDDWDFYWCDVHWVHENFDHIYLQEQQRINHFRNHYELTRKDLLVKNVKRMIKTMEKEYGKSEGQKFEFICTSYYLPQEHAMFQEEFKRNPGSVWIMKPVGKSQGKGIFLINKLSQISQWKKDARGNIKVSNNLVVGSGDGRNDASVQGRSETGEPPEAYIVQRYIENPYLIGGKKFDLRIYVLTTSYYPLDIHATNVAIQKHSPNYDSDKGCKWLLRNLKTYLTSKHGTGPVTTLFTEIEALVVRSLMSVQKVMINDKHCFELYGYDVLIDADLKPWLLEVNASPSLTGETPQDYDLKFNMLNDAFDVIDLEKKWCVGSEKKSLRSKVGGFDLVYNDGPVKQEKTLQYSSYLGCHHPIPKAPRSKRKSEKASGKVSRSNEE